MNVFADDEFMKIIETNTRQAAARAVLKEGLKLLAKSIELLNPNARTTPMTTGCTRVVSETGRTSFNAECPKGWARGIILASICSAKGTSGERKSTRLEATKS